MFVLHELNLTLHGATTLVKGVTSYSRVELIRVATTEDEHFFGTSFGVCFFIGVALLLMCFLILDIFLYGLFRLKDNLCWYYKNVIVLLVLL